MLCDIDDTPLDPPYFRLQVTGFSGHMPSGIEVLEGGEGWAVCYTCGELIESERWGEILRRSVAAREPYTSGTERSAVIANLGALYSLLRENLNGIELVSE